MAVDDDVRVMLSTYGIPMFLGLQCTMNPRIRSYRYTQRSSCSSVENLSPLTVLFLTE